MDKPGGDQPRQGKHALSRRKFLTVAGSAGVAVAATQFPFAKARSAPARFTGYPFTLGIASGDPTSDSVVLWTRLAPSPLEGNGGMPDKAIAVQWEVAKDENFTQVVASGEELATYGDAHSVHAEPQGLQAGFEYFYRFKANGEISPVGRTKTAPSGPTGALAFAFASCQQYEHGYYTAYRHMSQEDLDLIVHVGDYIYEYDSNSYMASGGNVRANSNHEVVNLADYRERYAQYKTDPDLQAAHACAPWLVTFDDHEIDNNWEGDLPEDGMPAAVFARRRRAGFKAYWEHLPLRKAARPAGNAIQIFRRAQYADLATFHVLDTRQFRSHQGCGPDGQSSCDDRTSPARTIMGAAQEQWLYDGLQGSRATWQILANQVFMAQSDYAAGAAEVYNMDAWDGYKVSRDKLLDFIDTRGIANPVVITGDVHQNWAANLLRDFRDADSKILGTELIGTSISTTGDGSDTVQQAVLTENPWIKFNNARRGYVRVSLDQQTCRADYRIVPYIKRPGAPISTLKSYVVEAGNPGLEDA